MKYENAVEVFLDRLPELKKVIESDERDLPQVALGSFAQYFSIKICDSLNSEFVTDSIALLNEMSNTHDEKIQTLLMTGVLEVILDNKIAFDTLRAQANQNLLQMMIKVEKFWRG